MHRFRKQSAPKKEFWRGGRVVDCGGLENRCTARYPGFESLSLRQRLLKEISEAFFIYRRYKAAYILKLTTLLLFVCLFTFAIQIPFAIIVKQEQSASAEKYTAGNSHHTIYSRIAMPN